MGNTCCAQNCYTITGLYAKNGNTASQDNNIRKHGGPTRSNEETEKGSRFCRKEPDEPDYILVELEEELRVEQTSNPIKLITENENFNITDLSIKNMQDEFETGRKQKTFNMKQGRDEAFFIENGYVHNPLNGVEKVLIKTPKKECPTPLLYKISKEGLSPVCTPKRKDSQFLQQNEFAEIFS